MVAEGIMGGVAQEVSKATSERAMANLDIGDASVPENGGAAGRDPAKRTIERPSAGDPGGPGITSSGES
jgi:hypothetical protein